VPIFVFTKKQESSFQKRVGVFSRKIIIVQGEFFFLLESDDDDLQRNVVVVVKGRRKEMGAATKTRNRRTEMGEESGVFRVGDARGDVVSGRGLLGVESACGGFHFCE
jgi:hypothetical protein